MTLQKPISMAMIAEQERKERQRIAILSITERKIAKLIAQSKRPVIIITQSSAQSYGNLSKRLQDILPNIPVIFENSDAQMEFKRSSFSMADNFNNRVVGYFEKIDTYESNQLCDELKKSDCAIVLGTPKPDLQKELDRHGNYITGDKVNLSLIEGMKRKTDAWATWNKDVQRRPSL